MSQVAALESDKVINRTLFNNFGKLLVLVFYAEWNEPSQRLRDNLVETIPLFGQFDNVKYILVSNEKCPETFKKFGVEFTPTVLFSQTDKKVLKKWETDDVGTIFDSLAEESETHRITFEQERKIWHPKVKSILTESPVIVFIKGTPQAPKCGFTETMLKILEENQIQFTFYDIIADEQMRFWVRHYSGWATYPQIYSQGKLIGGLDVCKDLVSKGQFLPLFPRSCRVTTAEEKYQHLIKEHPLLFITNGFSFEDKKNEAFLAQAQQKYKDASIINVALDQTLRKYILELTQKDFPLVVERGQVREL